MTFIESTNIHFPFKEQTWGSRCLCSESLFSSAAVCNEPFVSSSPSLSALYLTVSNVVKRLFSSIFICFVLKGEAVRLVNVPCMRGIMIAAHVALRFGPEKDRNLDRLCANSHHIQVLLTSNPTAQDTLLSGGLVCHHDCAVSG
jgi:hypothetical protein